MVIAALMHCDLFKIFCAPPNLGDKTRIDRIRSHQIREFCGIQDSAQDMDYWRVLECIEPPGSISHGVSYYFDAISAVMTHHLPAVE